MKKRSIKKLSLQKSAISNLNLLGGDNFNSRYVCYTIEGQHTCDDGPYCKSLRNECKSQIDGDPLCPSHNNKCESVLLAC